MLSKIDIKTYLFVAINLVGWGITVGTLLTRVSALEHRMVDLATQADVQAVMTKQQLDHITTWHSPLTTLGKVK